jgi:hypothetical protein
VSRLLAEIDADQHSERLRRLRRDGATLEDALILWDELDNPRAMLADVADASVEYEPGGVGDD